METVVVALITALASFLGSWAALKVHLQYLRRDVDGHRDEIKALREAIETLQRRCYGRRNYDHHEGGQCHG
jgi:hypothetical protein